MTEPGKALGHLRTQRSVAPRAAPKPARHTVTLIPGDGAGEEIAEAVVRVLEAADAGVAWDRQVAGPRALATTGSALPASLVESIRAHRVALEGRIAAPLEGGPGAVESPNVALRKVLDLYASVRPARPLAGLKSRYEAIDLVVIRENTEDLYAGIEHEVVPGVVESLKVVTETASTRIARFAFDYAARHGRREVTCVHKANIMKMSDGLFLECCRAVAAGHPQIAYRELIADNAIMQLVLDPRRFDVLVAGNMLGDILSDLCAGLAGGPGTVPGINVGDACVVFEAIHGQAPHLEGQDLASPLPLLIPAVAMLRHLGEEAAADRVMTGIGRTLAERACLTPDLGGASRTGEMAQAIIERLGEPPSPGT